MTLHGSQLEKQQMRRAVDDIIRVQLKSSKYQARLLRLLADADTAVTDEMIKRGAYELGNEFRLEPEAIRRLVSDLRKVLRVAGQLHQEYVFEIPPSDGTGYWLRPMRKSNLGRPATEKFWQDYCSSNQRVMLVHNENIFFTNGSYVIRIPTVNSDGVEARERLAEIVGQEAWRLEVSQDYILIGEERAKTMLREWFLQRFDVRIDERASNFVSSADIETSSPILMGKPRTNKFIRETFERAHQLKFRMDERSRGIELRGLSSEWLDEISARTPGCVSKDGEGVVRMQDDWNGVSFVLITRLPSKHNPDGVTTMITSEVTRSIGKVVETLTSDGRLHSLLVDVWSKERTPPNSFQILAAVRHTSRRDRANGTAAEFVAAERYD